jgi:hypothetical protein
MCTVERCRARNFFGIRVGNCTLSGEIDGAISEAVYDIGQIVSADIYQGLVSMLGPKITAGCLYAKKINDDLTMSSKKTHHSPQTGG